MKIIEKVSKEDLKKHLININLEDKNLYDEVQKNQFGIFQFSGNTASRMIKEAHIDNFNDLVSVNALSRPGSSFSFPDFCKNGDSGSKYPETISKYLKDSRGCILFQEQCMRLIESFTNEYSVGDNNYIDDNGEEKNTDYYSIELENGKILELLPYETVKTNNGNKKAKDLTENDEIII